MPVQSVVNAADFNLTPQNDSGKIWIAFGCKPSIRQNPTVMLYAAFGLVYTTMVDGRRRPGDPGPVLGGGSEFAVGMALAKQPAR